MRISDNHFCNLVRLSLKIPVGKGCGFVQFADRKNAEDALQALNGTVIGKQTVCLSWVAVQVISIGEVIPMEATMVVRVTEAMGLLRHNQDLAMQPAAAAIQGAS